MDENMSLVYYRRVLANSLIVIHNLRMYVTKIGYTSVGFENI